MPDRRNRRRLWERAAALAAAADPAGMAMWGLVTAGLPDDDAVGAVAPSGPTTPGAAVDATGPGRTLPV